jgi:hypothetical protein
LTRFRFGLAVALAVVSPPIAVAEPAGWRLFAGTFHTAWQSEVFHGHTEDCRTRACERSDFEKGNLDGSIGWRAGAERAVWRRGRFEVLAGAEVDVVLTEYNLSQRDFAIGELLAAGGLRVDLGVARLDLRAGAGGAAIDDGTRAGLASFVELSAEVPLSSSAAVRLGARRAFHGEPRSDEISILLVSGATDAPDTSAWDVAWIFGFSEPGRALGRSRDLTTAPLACFSLYRRLPSGLRLGLSYVTTAHESARRTDLYFGVPGNSRGATIQGFAAALDKDSRAFGNVRWRYGVGVEVSSWEDEYGLLFSSGTRPLEAGIDVAAAAALGLAIPIHRNLRVVVGAEQLYWVGIKMGELRLLSGIEISP